MLLIYQSDKSRTVQTIKYEQFEQSWLLGTALVRIRKSKDGINAYNYYKLFSVYIFCQTANKHGSYL